MEPNLLFMRINYKIIDLIRYLLFIYDHNSIDSKKLVTMNYLKYKNITMLEH